MVTPGRIQRRGRAGDPVPAGKSKVVKCVFKNSDTDHPREAIGPIASRGDPYGSL